MPVHSETRTCKGCGASFDQVIKKGRPYQKCGACRTTKKEKAATV